MWESARELFERRKFNWKIFSACAFYSGGNAQQQNLDNKSRVVCIPPHYSISHVSDGELRVDFGIVMEVSGLNGSEGAVGVRKENRLLAQRSKSNISGWSQNLQNLTSFPALQNRPWFAAPKWAPSTLLIQYCFLTRVHCAQEASWMKRGCRRRKLWIGCDLMSD